MFLHFIVEKDEKLLGALVVFSLRRIVDPTIGEDPIHVSFEEMLCYVISKMRLE